MSLDFTNKCRWCKRDIVEQADGSYLHECGFPDDCAVIPEPEMPKCNHCDKPESEHLSSGGCCFPDSRTVFTPEDLP